jgi:hypothetical protein
MAEKLDERKFRFGQSGGETVKSVELKALYNLPID